MNTKLRLYSVIAVASTLIVSCGGGAPTTPSPATEPSTLITDVPATVPPTLITEVPLEEIQSCSVLPDGDGQSYGGKVSSLTILDEPHGFYVYADVLAQIEKSNDFVVPANAPTSINELIVILVVDVYLESLVNESDFAESSEIDSFIKGADLYLDNSTSEKGILVVAVDTKGLDYNEISKNISAALKYFTQSTDVVFHSDTGFDATLPKATGIVVNMSFVFVPCDSDVLTFIDPVLKNIDTEKPELNIGQIANMEALGSRYDDVDRVFYDYVNCLNVYAGDCRQAIGDLRLRLQALYPDYATSTDIRDQIDASVFNAFVADLAYDPVADQSWLGSFPTAPCLILDDSSPLMTLQDCMNYYSTISQGSVFPSVVYVGAAGNFERNLPFAPAYWDTVIGVSSQSSPQESNPQVLDLATGLELAEYSNWGEVQQDGVYLDESNFASNIFGTSFAAPKFSALVAQHMLLGSSCPMSFNSLSETGPWNNSTYNCTP